MEKSIELLKQHKLRKTAGRIDILSYFTDNSYALSHKDIEQELGNKYDRVTIYRILGSFEESGLIHRIFDESGLVKYALCLHNCDTKHHDDEHLHFQCDSCGKTFCIDHFPIPTIQLPSNFKTKELYVLAKGTCEQCS